MTSAATDSNSMESVNTPLLGKNTQNDVKVSDLVQLLKASRIWGISRSFVHMAAKPGYALLLLWQLVGLTVWYIPRALQCSLKEEALTHYCNDSMVVPNDKEIELAWMTSHVINELICLCVLVTWHGTSGLKRVFRKLISLANFWVLAFLSFLSALSCVIIVVKSRNVDIPAVGMAIFGSFCIQHAAMALMIPVLNYTSISGSTKAARYSKASLILVKATHILLFFVNFTLFVVGTIQLGFNISALGGLPKNAGTIKFQRLFSVMRRFSNAMFYYIVQRFLWFKIFDDDKNILSHMEKLELPTEAYVWRAIEHQLA